MRPSKKGESVIRPLQESSQWKKTITSKKTHPTDTYSNTKKLGRFNKQSYVCTNVKQDPGFFNVPVRFALLPHSLLLATHVSNRANIDHILFFKWHLLSLAV